TDNVYTDKVYRTDSQDYAAYDEPAADIVILSQDELADLVGPIALYPDDLLAIVLPASTYPLQIVQAARFLEDYENDTSLQPSEDWDESIIALLNYPEVVRLMSEDLSWTWELGGAVLNQQQDVILATETFRDRAYDAGNLRSDEFQTIDYDGDSIEITPVNEEVIYVPYYEPRRVVVRHVEPAYYYYPRPYPVYYYPYPASYSFSNGFFWGVTTSFRIGWSSRHLHVRHHSFRGHPYYGYRYSNHYYRQPSIQIFNNWYVNNSGRHSNNRYRDGDRWRPRPNNGARPNGHGSDPANRRDRNQRNTAIRDTGDGITAQRPETGSRFRANQANGVNRAPAQRRADRRETPNRRPVVQDSSRQPSTTPSRPVNRDNQRKRPVVAGDQSRTRFNRPVANRPVTTTGDRRGTTHRPAVSGLSAREPVRQGSSRRYVSSERRVTSKPDERRAAMVQRKPAARQSTPAQRKPVRQASPTQRKPARQAAPTQRKPVTRNKPADQKTPRRENSGSNRDSSRSKTKRDERQKR
ncbi:MAG: DUF3300 domain-containing protein, partial [Gammaproteobacteria bacterium]|nr:DUF3300 domain-containing protein [Gammaproteobacteria bacterium]